jgi:hypothetical protein
MTDPSTEDDLHVNLTVDDARTAQAAEAKFACTLIGRLPQAFAAPLNAGELGLAGHARLGFRHQLHPPRQFRHPPLAL